MFSVYGTGGTVFRGSLEDLQRVSRTLGLTAPRKLDRVVDHFQTQATQVQAEAEQHAGRSIAQHAHHEYARVQSPKPTQRQALITVKDVMSRKLIVIPLKSTVQEAWQFLLDGGIGQAPVVDASQKLVGMLTRAELMRLDRLPSPDQAGLVWRALLMQPVSRVMITPVAGVTAETDLRRLARVLLDTELPGMPVVSETDELVGFVSRSDILKALVNEPPIDLWG
ncbi:MAG: CBS domain-containing protein [Betaproteobacteria bacterium]|jgi:CBS domain-containing protein|nr:CBS domain-containing protein [Betaproteobacteria bacterium]MBK7654945.1 CBS domain-containing protein [Betaproteobacteria bacterium]